MPRREDDFMDDTASRNEESHYQDSQSSQLQPSRRSYLPNDNQIFQHRSSQPSIPGDYYQSADPHSRGIESALPRNCSSSLTHVIHRRPFSYASQIGNGNMKFVKYPIHVSQNNIGQLTWLRRDSTHRGAVLQRRLLSAVGA